MTPKSELRDPLPRGGTGTVLVVARGFFDSFPEEVTEETVRACLASLGLATLREVAPHLPPYLSTMKGSGSETRPSISSACPPANEWLSGNAPRLASLLVDIPSPAEEAFAAAAREASTEASRKGTRAVTTLVFVSPCEAKKAAMLSFCAKLRARPEFSGLVFSVVDLGPLRAAILADLGLSADLPPRREEPPALPSGVLFVEGRDGLAALASGGPPAGTLAILPFWCEGGCNGAGLGEGRGNSGAMALEK